MVEGVQQGPVLVGTFFNKHKRHTTVGNPVSIARALRQPVPCR